MFHPFSNIERIAELICGDDKSIAPVYRSSWYLTRFFESAGLPRFKHDGSTRKWWVLDCLKQCSNKEIRRVILTLASPQTYMGQAEQTELALKSLNEVLNPEGLSIQINGVKPGLLKIEPRLSRPIKTDEQAEELADIEPPNFEQFGLDAELSNLLDIRWDEIKKCLQSGAHLASIILMGSLLEGVLYWLLMKHPEKSNRALSAPKDPKTGKNKSIHEWTLSQMIDVAHELRWLGVDVKKFSHSLRDFRNLVHPYQQKKEGTIPDEDTCKISWQVIRASMNDLVKAVSPKTPAGG